MTTADRIYIDEMAKLLDRVPHTLRQWIREAENGTIDDGVLPNDLLPHREGGRQRIYWEQNQLQGLRDYAEERAQRRGWQPATG